MRVVGGNFSGLRLNTLKGDTTRPTADQVKENVFNLLGGTLTGTYCLDFYGGSGALGIEAVSRGMGHCVITEANRKAQDVIQANIEKTKQEEKFTLLKGNNRKTLAKWRLNNNEQFSLVFLDPPYFKAKHIDDINWLNEGGYLRDDCLVVCEWNEGLTDIPSNWTIYKEKRYGSVYITILQKNVSGE